MKKLLAILLASAVSLGTVALVGCGDNSSDSGNDGGSSNLPNDGNNGNDDNDDENTKPELPSDEDDYKSDLTKPVMPTDKDMQTVAGENVYEEFLSYYRKLKGNVYGEYKAYVFTNDVGVNKGEFREYDGEDYLDKTEKATYNKKRFTESYDDYGGISENGSMTGAITTYRNYVEEDKIDSTNSNLAYLNHNSNYLVTKVGIQKGSQLYNFETADISDEKGSVKVDNQLRFYEENAKWNKPDDFYIPCAYATSMPYHYDVTALYCLFLPFEKASQYVEDNNAMLLALVDKGMEELEGIAYYGKIEAKNFELTAKKNEEKFFASLKYTMEYTYSNDSTETVESEYIVLFDLSQPNSVTALPSNGININDLSLSTEADKIAYPDITSEQLTAAVKEGKEITVNIAGGGEVENLTILGIGGQQDVLPVTDGKVTIDGAQIKNYIDEIRKVYEGYGFPIDITFNISYTYNYAEDEWLNGNICIDY